MSFYFSLLKKPHYQKVIIFSIINLLKIQNILIKIPINFLVSIRQIPINKAYLACITLKNNYG